MKTFLAVLAAGAILFAVFVGWQRLDRWEQAKDYWTAQFRQAQENMPRDIPHDIMVNLSVDDLNDAINRLDHANRTRSHAAHELRLYLVNKPFGLPLTAEENRLLTEIGKTTDGRQLHDDRKAIVQSEPTATSTPNTPTAAPSPTPTAMPPAFIALTKPVTIKIRYGIISLNPGTQLKLISRGATTARVQYDGVDQEIPLASTNLP